VTDIQMSMCIAKRFANGSGNTPLIYAFVFDKTDKLF